MACCPIIMYEILSFLLSVVVSIVAYYIANSWMGMSNWQPA